MELWLLERVMFCLMCGGQFKEEDLGAPSLHNEGSSVFQQAGLPHKISLGARKKRRSAGVRLKPLVHWDFCLGLKPTFLFHACKSLGFFMKPKGCFCMSL